MDPSEYVQYQGSLNRVVYINRLGTVPRIGSVTRVGSVNYLGSVNRLGGGRLGSVGAVGTVRYVPRMGTIGHVGSVYTGTVPTNIRAAEMVATVIRDRVPLGLGTTWVGSWQYVGSWPFWQFAVWGRPSAGSFAIVGGVQGTGADGMTGTIYGYQQVAGTILDFHPPPSVRRAVRYVRPVFLRTGNLRGSVSVGLTKQAQ